MSEREPDWEMIADGLALFQEHAPQSGEDWVAVADRCFASGELGLKGSPLFRALMIQTAALALARSVLREGGSSVYPPNYPDTADPTGPPSTDELLGGGARETETLREALRTIARWQFACNERESDHPALRAYALDALASGPDSPEQT